MNSTSSPPPFYDFSPICSLTSCNSLIYTPLAMILVFFLLIIVLSLYQHSQNQETSHSLVLLDLLAIQFDRVQEFIDNVDNRDYFPAESTAKPLEQNKEIKGSVVINQPVIVREKNQAKEGISVRDLLLK